MKVIFISMISKYVPDRYVPGSPQFFLFGMGQFIANEFRRRNYPAEFEIWRADSRIKSKMESEIDGIRCKIFPSCRLKTIGELSLSMMTELRSESKGKKTVFHFLSSHLLSYHIYSFIVRHSHVVCNDQGNPNPLWVAKNEAGKSLKSLAKKCLYSLLYMLERSIFIRSYDCFFTICKPEIEYYRSLGSEAVFNPRGITRENLFAIKDRGECRKKLGLREDKKIILQVGRAVKYRGFDWIIRLMDHYRDDDDVEFVIVGINDWDPYRNELLKRRCTIKGFMNHTDLVDYYNAADVFIFLYSGAKVLTFGGVGYVAIEALSCGTPVVATSLFHIKEYDIDAIAKIPVDYSELEESVEELLINPPDRKLCSEIIRSIFSWDKTLQTYWKYYTS